MLKTYSCVLIERGYHSLFFPGGTRSRSGGVERRLKLGLAGTGIEAFVRTAMQGRTQRVFFVPATINYLLTLEADPDLLEQAVINLVKNALEAVHGPDPSVTLVLKRTAREAVIAVEGAPGGSRVRWSQDAESDQDGYDAEARLRKIMQQGLESLRDMLEGVGD